MPKMDRIGFLGCPVDNLNMSDALDWMDRRIKARHPSMISVVNANKLWLMSKNPRLKKIVAESDLILSEWAVYWGAKRLGTPLKACVYGIALAQKSLQWAADKGYSIFFLGAKPEVIETLEIKLRRDFPELQVAGFQHGYLDSDESQKVINKIYRTEPDLLFVAMGSPKQEYWIMDHFGEIQVPVSIGIGGSFDVLAGLKRDTPSWARGRGLEWLYRLSQDPKAYWKRYLITNSWIIWKVSKAYFQKK
jgi:N-acetylglucosaminyldiphosphoundecaprenol N-acetyl-beta-D-mannosaminyltransferase